MMSKFCKISLAPLTGREKIPGYTNKSLRALFGTTVVVPQLNFTHSEFARQGAQATQGLSISGVQEKLSVRIEDRYLVAVSRGGRLILKPAPRGYEFAPENEHAAMLVSRAVGIETAECGLVSFSDGELAYITRRFDRDEQGKRIAQEDLASVADLPAADKYETSYEALGYTVLEACAGKKGVVLDYLTRVMLAYVMGNDDLHAKNFSLRRRPGSTAHHYDSLSPNYDVLFVSSFEGPDSGQFLALDMLDGEDTEAFGHYGFYTGHDFLALGERLTLPRRAILRAFKQIANAVPNIERIVDRSFMPVPMKQKAASTVRERVRALELGLVA